MKRFGSTEQAAAFPFDILDPTKIVPEEMVPRRAVGKMVLDRNPDNFFAETEQVAFCAAHVVPGVEFTDDPLLQGRIHSYIDTQISRLAGPNFHEIPINAPIAPIHNNQRDGFHRQSINRGRVAYEPNSLAGGCPFQAGAAGFVSFPERVSAPKVRGKPALFADHYSQARLFWKSQTPVERQHIIDAFRFELTRVQTPAIRRRMLAGLANVDEQLVRSVAEGLGMAVPPPLPLATDQPMFDYPPSPALSLFHYPGHIGIHTRRVAILAGPDVDSQQVRKLYTHLLDEGAVPRLIGERLFTQPLEVEITFETAPSVLFDAAIIPDGAATSLAQNNMVIEFLNLQYRHDKPIMALGNGEGLLLAAGVPQGDGLIVAPGAEGDQAFLRFVEVLARHRIYSREGTQAGLRTPEFGVYMPILGITWPRKSPASAGLFGISIRGGWV